MDEVMREGPHNGVGRVGLGSLRRTGSRPRWEEASGLALSARGQLCCHQEGPRTQWPAAQSGREETSRPEPWPWTSLVPRALRNTRLLSPPTSLCQCHSNQSQWILKQFYRTPCLYGEVEMGVTVWPGSRGQGYHWKGGRSGWGGLGTCSEPTLWLRGAGRAAVMAATGRGAGCFLSCRQ